jgi:hypothetical protein
MGVLNHAWAGAITVKPYFGRQPMGVAFVMFYLKGRNGRSD